LFDKLAEGAEFGRCEHQFEANPPAPIQSAESFENRPSGASAVVQFEKVN
jgi:hypothetical protein